MSKLTYEDKINLYKDRKNGLTILKLVSKYNIRHEGVEYLIRLIDNEPRNSVAIDEGLSSSGMLPNRIKKYQDMGYNIVERKRGRSPTIMTKNRNVL